MTRLLFFGNERLATGLATDAPIFRSLLDAGYDIAGLVVAQKVSSASRKARDPEIIKIAQQHSIPVIAPEKLSEAIDQIRDFDAAIGVLVAYGKIVPQSVIDVFEHGIVNIHPSLLPLHRGPIPLEGVILADEKQTGVSIMRLAAHMDAGPVYVQQSIDLSGNETKQELAEQLMDIGKNLLLKNLPAIVDGSLKPKDQDHTKATYDKRIEKAAAELDFQKPATTLLREIRAYAGWPRSRCNIGLHEVIISKAHCLEANGVAGTLYLEDKNIGMYCGEGVLVFDRLVPTGKKEMDGSAFLSGYQL